MLSGAGHGLMVEAAGAYNKAVAEFLERVVESGRAASAPRARGRLN